eukprot:767633-Hanusia_phi.AAC.2
MASRTKRTGERRRRKGGEEWQIMNGKIEDAGLESDRETGTGQAGIFRLWGKDALAVTQK